MLGFLRYPGIFLLKIISQGNVGYLLGPLSKRQRGLSSPLGKNPGRSHKLEGGIPAHYLADHPQVSRPGRP